MSLENGAPFNNEQDLLDTLFDGRIYINIHTADHASGEIKAVLVYDASVTPPPTAALTAIEVDLDIVRFLNQATFGATPADYADPETPGRYCGGAARAQCNGQY